MINTLNIDKFRILENIEIKFGKTITAIAGHNALGKSTILGLVGNIVEYKEYNNIFGKKYRTEFSEIFKATPEYDKTGQHKGHFTINEKEIISFRSAWQNNNTRFRIIPKRQDHNNNNTESKYPLPVIYLGLSRLYPIGEVGNEGEKIDYKLTEIENKWFIDNYKTIFSSFDTINNISGNSTKEVKSNFVGINTNKYNTLTNSAGQDNLSQILLSIISFRRLKQKITNENKEWNGGVFIIDEIDATLHPKAQVELINILHKNAKKLNVQIIFTTHSLSIMKYMTEKYENKPKFGNAFVLNFISNANQKIRVLKNPTYELIKNNLCVTLSEKSKKQSKIIVYSEDDDTRWFLKKLLYGHNNKLDLINIDFGCDQLYKLLIKDPIHFSKVLFVVDADVKQSNKKFTDKSNVLALPGETRPENILYDYLSNPDSNIWDNEDNIQNGFTMQYIQDNGPESSNYNNKTIEREKFSSWFYDKKKELEDYKVFNYWKKENLQLVEEFRTEFITKYNLLAIKNNIDTIKK